MSSKPGSDPPPLLPEERHRRVEYTQQAICACLNLGLGGQPDEHATAGALAILTRLLVMTAASAQMPIEHVLRGVNAAALAHSEGRLMMASSIPKGANGVTQ